MSLTVEKLVSATNNDLTQLRLLGPKSENNQSNHSDEKSVLYVQDFWPHLCKVINSDPDKLGLSLKIKHGENVIVLKADDLMNGFIEENGGPGVDLTNLKLGSILSSIALMEKCISVASENWAKSMVENPKSELPFRLNNNEFVSLRMLFPRKKTLDHIPEAEAPTLVTGGTMTAIYLCWNLLHRSQTAYSEKFNSEPNREIMERIWKDTRELIFRLGNGSLASFISFASACSSNSKSMIWDGINDLELIEDGNRLVWCANSNLERRYLEMLETVLEAQNGSYTGCAALFSRSSSLPLPSSSTDLANEFREHNVFSELLRWITAIARKQYFSRFLLQ